MTVKLYNYQGDERRVDKSSKVLKKTVVMNPVDATNLLSPSFTVDYDASILTANYAEVADFNHRFYFVSPPTLIKGGRLLFKFSVDVTQIPNFLTIIGTIRRNENVKDSPVADNMYPVKVGQQSLKILELPLNLQENLKYIDAGMYGMFKYLITK